MISYFNGFATTAAVAIMLLAMNHPLSAASTLQAGIAPVKLDLDAENALSGEARISVHNGTLRYASDPNDSLGVDTTVSGTVQDYRFFSGSSASTVANGSNDLISALSGTFGTKSYSVTIWDSTDPGAGFGSGADVTTNGFRTASTTTGTVDISGLSSGSIYFLYGNNGSSSPRGFNSITMSGTALDQSLTNYSELATAGNGIAETAITSVDFTNEGDYDTITYEMGGFTYFSGLVVTGVAIPEPSVALLGGIGALLLLRRRR